MSELFREAFEGRADGKNYTWFVEGSEGIFDAIEHLTCEQASTRLKPDCSTIAAHINHIRFTLAGCNASIRQENPSMDWESSWAIQEVDEEAWKQLAADLRAEYEWTLAWLGNDPVFPEQGHLTGAMALLPHMGYHLGAVRQLMKMV